MACFGGWVGHRIWSWQQPTFASREDGWPPKMLVLCTGQVEVLGLRLNVGQAIFCVHQSSGPYI